MILSITLLYISYTIPPVYAEPSQTEIFFMTPTQDYRSANLSFPGTDGHSPSGWNPTTDCLLPGGPNTNAAIGKDGACNNLPKYYYFDETNIPPGDTTRIAITLPEYILDCNITAAQAKPGANDQFQNLANWYLDYGLKFMEGENPGVKIVCTNTSTTQ